MYLFLKRVIDLFLSMVALLILSPLLILIAMALLFTGDHSVFYRQKRIGYKSKPLKIWKFVSMVKNSDKIGNREITVRNDPRVTRMGRILRITKMNELPQLINVLSGNMSIVGPRPLMKVSYDLYPAEIGEKIYLSKPGITSIASVIFRDEEKLVSDATNPRVMYQAIFPYKGKLELWYQDHTSLVTDIKIIFLTGWSLIFRNNNLATKLFKGLPERNFEHFEKMRKSPDHTILGTG